MNLKNQKKANRHHEGGNTKLGQKWKKSSLTKAANDYWYIFYSIRFQKENSKNTFLKQAYNSAYYEKMKLVNISSFATRILGCWYAE